MTHHADKLVELTDEQAGVASIRAAFGVWMDVLSSLSDAAYHLRVLDEHRQAEAMRIDAESMARRAKLHLHNMTVRERTRLALDVAPANDNDGSGKDSEGAA